MKRRTAIPRPGIPPFICIEDTEHTARCIAAIRKRKRREGMAVIVEPKQWMERNRRG
jgi:hypothetical protein